MDVVPENVALRVSLAADEAGGSTALLVAIFASNVPESPAEAVEHGRPLHSLATPGGCFLSFLLSG